MIKKKNLAILIILSILLLFNAAYAEKEGKKQKKEKEKKYFSSTSFSALLTSGNSKDFTFSIDTDQNLHIGKNSFNFKGKIIYARSDKEKKSEIYFSTLKYNFHLNSRTYLLGLTKFDRNVLAGYNSRFAVSAGAGYTWLQREKIDISSEAAFGWSTENNAERVTQQFINNDNIIKKPNISSSFVSAIISSKIICNVSSTTQLMHQEILFISLKELAGYRINSYFSISVSISPQLALKTSIQISYENKPVPGYKSTDLFMLSSIVFKI